MRSRLERRMTITIQANLDDVALVGLSVRAISAFELFSQEEAILIELAVCEALNNAIIHGLPDRPDDSVQLEIVQTPDRLVFRISDRGPGIPEGIERFGQEHGSPLDTSGRGLAIMREVMDSVTYERRGERNILQLEKRTALPTLGTL